MRTSTSTASISKLLISKLFNPSSSSTNHTTSTTNSATSTRTNNISNNTTTTTTTTTTKGNATTDTTTTPTISRTYFQKTMIMYVLSIITLLTLSIGITFTFSTTASSPDTSSARTSVASTSSTTNSSSTAAPTISTSSSPAVTSTLASTVASTSTSVSPYKIVIDGGSTGSRLHVFEFKHDPMSNTTFVERRGSTKVNTPLSDFASSSSSSTSSNDDTTTTTNQEAALHLLPLFKYASQIIPDQYHKYTPISFQATAGMRLVQTQYQNELYDTIYNTLMDHDEFVFQKFHRDDISTLDGMLEGLYGVIAVNYLKGVVDVNLHYNDDINVGDIVSDDNDNFDNESNQCHAEKNSQDKVPLGALDMGGASMQIVYLPPSSLDSDSDANSNTTSSTSKSACSEKDAEDVREKLPSHEFFSTSYLSYGSDQFRERLWDTWVMDMDVDVDINNIQEQDSDNRKNIIIHNPCSFKGHETLWKGYTLLGTGDAQLCTKEVNRLIPVAHHQEMNDSNNNYNNMVGGIEHPPINGEFYAMSLFFFVMDCVKTYTKDETLLQSWPKPSIHELSLAIDSFCSKHWYDDIIHHHGDDIHEFTRSEILSERCFESVYIVTLLRDGFGFDVHSRDITYSFLVDGSEVEWSLGMAISLYAQDDNILLQ